MSKREFDELPVSEYNWLEEVRLGSSQTNKFEIHDATMRDGAHVVDFTDKERIQLAEALSDLGLRRIEIESRARVIKRQSIFPAEQHWKTMKEIANMGLKADIFTMRNVTEGRAGIDKALKYDVKNIVLQEPVQSGWLENLGQTEEHRIDEIQDVITYAKEQGCFIDFFNNHIGYSKLDYLLRIVNAGIEAGSDTLCITDSEGVCTPQTFGFLVKRYIQASEGKIPIQVHPHNDYGLALANTIAGYEAGASIVHCCVNSLGSRAGNTSLEEAVIALRVLYDVDLGLDYGKLYDVCTLVETMQQWPVAKNKPFNGYGIYSGPYKLGYFGKRPHER